MTTVKRFARRGRMLVAGAVIASLAAAAIAIADTGTATTSLVSATFYANTLTSSHTQTCTGANNDAYQITDVTFTGTASSSDARLAGPISIHAVSVYDSTKNIGWLNGDLRVTSSATPPPPGHFHAHLTAVNVNSALQGFVAGDAGDGAHFMGSFSATFSPTGGFSSSGSPGSIGAGGGTNTAIVTSGGCTHHDDHVSDVHGNSGKHHGDHHGKHDHH
jgi:hypothetical protein